MTTTPLGLEGGDVAVSRFSSPGTTGRATGPRTPAWVYQMVGAYAVLAYCLVSFMLGAGGQRFPAVFAGIAATIFGLLFTTSARFSQAHPLSPRNWALSLFGLQLLAIPVLLIWLGPVRGVLPTLPSDDAINAAILLNAVAYVSFIAGSAVHGASSRVRVRQRSLGWLGHGDVPPILFIGLFALLGVVGLVFRFQTFANLSDYFLGRVDLTQILADRTASRATLGDAAGTFLSGALGFAFVLLWCRLIERLREDRGRHPLVGGVLSIAIGCAVALCYGVYLYNRGAVLVPLVALIAAYSLRMRRVPFAVLGIASALMIITAFEFGNVRAAYFNPQSVGLDYNQQIQIYGSAPQFTAFMLQGQADGTRLYPGETLISSLLYPVPVLGRQFRATSGVAIYNRLIYGFDGPTDQVVPFQGELFWNFGVLGVVLGFVGLGALIARLQVAFENAGTALRAYMIQYASVWLGLLVIGSLAVASQIAIYFMWPFVAIGILLALRRRLRSPQKVDVVEG